MSDVQLDLAELAAARDRAIGAYDTFSSADTVSGDLADLTGEARLAGKVRDFAANWDYNRGKLEDQLVTVRDLLTAIVDSFTELDAEGGRQP
ncbi:hypothetical protein [Microbacterium oleivorans]|uniref:hypothetical protein n=1 Tax=Microbacterium oleivorans TaxID=273677 RepID=UPI000AC19D7C|nr:hypothetical protein [Microbacterium oleivorans]